MAQKTKIEWTEESWNPVRGCTKISPGCTHCYAASIAHRFKGVKGGAYEGGFKLRLVPEQLNEPLKWTRPKLVFVNSMSDLFHKDVPENYIKKVCWVMQKANCHTFQVLTKRSERLRDFLTENPEYAKLENVWWGVSVENKKHGLPRIDHLRAAPAATRFLSCEPLLEDLGKINLRGIHWVIAGGESGPGARPMEADWARSIRQQCEASGSDFFFKQWGGVRKAGTGRTLDGKIYDEMPPRIELPVLRLKERTRLKKELCVLE
ncbi:phage Gp37/Gp68 family protein [Gemmata sp. G18]|uniref:Phage Gp37/Gp68 family protein n=1 Tax=Gemmata palustris TaxID=2822762 RepID=A0ABS5BUW3_9BACT|nr:phage Gp37/Gp68 family protein [Gemmata palustris]MBP3957435.1 phage Gp37/Gp68 family protein [Gemmata palustris]